MLFLMRAARPERAQETFRLVDDGAVTYCLSPAVIAEIQDVLLRSAHQIKFPLLMPERVAAFLSDITRRSRFIESVPDRYVLQRDPKDSKYINLALAAEAPYLVTREKDLLDLMDRTTVEGNEFQQRFPNLRIIGPAAFVREVPPSTG